MLAILPKQISLGKHKNYDRITENEELMARVPWAGLGFIRSQPPGAGVSNED